MSIETGFEDSYGKLETEAASPIDSDGDESQVVVRLQLENKDFPQWQNTPHCLRTWSKEATVDEATAFAVQMETAATSRAMQIQEVLSRVISMFMLLLIRLLVNAIVLIRYLRCT